MMRVIISKGKRQYAEDLRLQLLIKRAEDMEPEIYLLTSNGVGGKL